MFFTKRRSKSHLGRSWGRLGPSWGDLGPSWDRLGAVLGGLGTVLGILGAVLEPPGGHDTHLQFRDGCSLGGGPPGLTSKLVY